MTAGLKKVLERIGDLDRVIHEPARLCLMACLSLVEEADFLWLLRQTGLTRGNLSSHLYKLEQVGYLTVHKAFVGRRPNTLYRLTPQGLAAFKAYRTALRYTLENLPEPETPSAEGLLPAPVPS